MSRITSFPTILNRVPQLSVRTLKELNYMERGEIRSGTITWSNQNGVVAQIDIIVNMKSGEPYIDLGYNYRGESRNYRIPLVPGYSNLGNGFIWYFQCPSSDKRCRILYCVNGWFLHREAFSNCIYESQRRSKWLREVDKRYGNYFKLDKLYSEFRKKYRKTHYRGIPTKRHVKLAQQIEQGESIPHWEIESLMMKRRR